LHPSQGETRASVGDYVDDRIANDKFKAYSHGITLCIRPKKPARGGRKMNKASKAVTIAIAAIASLSGLKVPAASSQAYYDHSDYGALRRYGARPEGCLGMISATGLGYPFGIGSRHSAIKAWKRQAWAAYGSDFSWTLAEDSNIECLPYLATIRCTASARPCS
jgi:hypothetical protein